MFDRQIHKASNARMFHSSLAAGPRHSVVLSTGGYVVCSSPQNSLETSTEHWRDIVSVAAGNVHPARNTGKSHTVGLLASCVPVSRASPLPRPCPSTPACVYTVIMIHSANRGGATYRERSRWFWAAAFAGGLHVGITLYWALGGQALLWTMGADFIAKLESMLWILWPVALVKAVGAFGPTWLSTHGWPWARLTRSGVWLGSVVLIGWGGLNTIICNMVLFGLINPAGGFDRPAMIGHAWIWDPLFLIWGTSLLIGLIRTHATRASLS